MRATCQMPNVVAVRSCARSRTRPGSCWPAIALAKAAFSRSPLAEGGLLLRLPVGRHVSQHLVAKGLGLFLGAGLPVPVAVTLGDRIESHRDDHLVPGAVRPDVTFGFPHRSTIGPLPR